MGCLLNNDGFFHFNKQPKSSNQPQPQAYHRKQTETGAQVLSRGSEGSKNSAIHIMYVSEVLSAGISSQPQDDQRIPPGITSNPLTNTNLPPKVLNQKSFYPNFLIGNTFSNRYLQPGPASASAPMSCYYLPTPSSFMSFIPRPFHLTNPPSQTSTSHQISSKWCASLSRSWPL